MTFKTLNQPILSLEELAEKQQRLIEAIRKNSGEDLSNRVKAFHEDYLLRRRAYSLQKRRDSTATWYREFWEIEELSEENYPILFNFHIVKSVIKAMNGNWEKRGEVNEEFEKFVIDASKDYINRGNLHVSLKFSRMWKHLGQADSCFSCFHIPGESLPEDLKSLRVETIIKSFIYQPQLGATFIKKYVDSVLSFLGIPPDVEPVRMNISDYNFYLGCLGYYKIKPEEKFREWSVTNEQVRRGEGWNSYREIIVGGKSSYITI